MGLLVLLLLLAGPTLAYKKIKRGDMSSTRKDNDGFSFFSRTAKKDNDAYYPRKFEDDDNTKHKSQSRRNNLYASKKMDEYG